MKQDYNLRTALFEALESSELGQFIEKWANILLDFPFIRLVLVRMVRMFGFVLLSYGSLFISWGHEVLNPIEDDAPTKRANPNQTHD